MISKVVTSLTAGINLGGQVPAGKKRWITFIAAKSGAAGGKAASRFTLHFASVSVSNPSLASIVATGNRKFLFHYRGTQTTGAARGLVQVPKIPNPECPLFSIAEGKWLGVAASITTAVMTIGYFEE